MELFYAVLFGTAFGFILNRIGATDPGKIINMLRLTDTGLMKVILFAIGAASIALFIGLAAGIIDPSHTDVKSAYTGVIIGGIIFGVGFAIAGLCPGTGVAALATGRKDALVFLIGGLAGAFAYMLSYGALAETFLMDKIAGGKASLADTGNIDYIALLPDMPALIVAGVIGLAMIAVAYFLPKKIRE